MNKLKEQDNFEVLRKIYKNPQASQREMAKELGFSLGKLNYCLKALKDKGFVKIKNFQKKNNYLILLFLAYLLFLLIFFLLIVILKE